MIENIIQGNKATYNMLAKEYEEKVSQRTDFNNQVVDKFIKHITTGKKVLDVGCGIGLNLQIFSERNLTPTGIDFSHEMVLFAKKRNPKTLILEGNFLETDILGPFDAIFAQAFIHLLPKPEAEIALEKIYNLLRPGGVAYLTITKSYENNNDEWIEKSDYQGGFKRFKTSWTKEEFKKSLKYRGFKILDIYEIGDPSQKIWYVFTVKK